MATFNRNDRRPSRGRDFNRRDSGGRGSDRPSMMYKATCAKCGKECEVPFRPTGERPVYCSNCFRNNEGSDSGRSNFEDRQMHDVVCDQCGKNCQVPFEPRSGKPVYCSDCFENKEKNGSAGDKSSTNQNQNKEQFEALNSKLDQILRILNSVAPETSSEVENK